MNPPHNPYGRIPEFFEQQCDTLWLPLASVVDDTQWFITAILALPEGVQQVRMRLYLEAGNGGYNYLACYLQVTRGLTHVDSWRVANEVLIWLRESGIPDTYRDVRK